MTTNAARADGCPFCHPRVPQTALWESEHYRVIADEFPRCVGHVLLLTKAHSPCHAALMDGHEPEFLLAQARVRRFLHETFGAASFFEHGGGERQDVPHAHLHGFPLAATLPPPLRDNSGLQPVRDWLDVRQEWVQSGHYVYVETGEGRFLIPDACYDLLLDDLRHQLATQTEATIDPRTRMLVRLEPAVADRTRQTWKEWESGQT